MDLVRAEIVQTAGPVGEWAERPDVEVSVEFHVTPSPEGEAKLRETLKAMHGVTGVYLGPSIEEFINAGEHRGPVTTSKS